MALPFRLGCFYFAHFAYGSAAAAAWSLVHGLSHLILDGHFAQRDEEFVKRVLGVVRFAVGPHRSA